MKTIHLTVKFAVPAALLGDREAFIAEARRRAAETAQEAAETLWAMEVAPEPEKALEPSPSPAVTHVPTSPPTQQWKPGDEDSCLACT